MVEGEAGRPEGGELGLDLGCELPADGRPEEEGGTRQGHVLTEESPPVDEAGDLGWRQQGPPLDQHKVKAHPEARQPSRALDGIGRRGRSHHQARCGQQAPAMRLFHGLVDLRRQPEVVGRDDQAFQLASSRRSRRK